MQGKCHSLRPLSSRNPLSVGRLTLDFYQQGWNLMFVTRRRLAQAKRPLANKKIREHPE